MKVSNSRNLFFQNRYTVTEHSMLLLFDGGKQFKKMYWMQGSVLLLKGLPDEGLDKKTQI